jgi:large subunit ribosomal protein L30
VTEEREPKGRQTGTIRIRYVRSAIGRSKHQKLVVRGLGLRKLNQVVERPDTRQIRGMVAKIPHLVQIVEGNER